MNIGVQNLGTYKLQERLASVGRVETWKAIDPSLRRYVTINLLRNDQQHDPGLLARFEREAKIIQTLHHPNIMQVYETHVARSPEHEPLVGYIVMEYREGITLTDYIRTCVQTRKLPCTSEIVYLFNKICDALSYAHQKGIVHGDIHPDTIILPPRTHRLASEPLLTGFATAKLQGTSPQVLSLWGVKMPLYLSSEQCRGYPCSEQSDIYPLGVMLYELCTGVHPFQGDSPAAMMMQHIKTPPKPPILINASISPVLSAIILRCLEKNPRQRFPTVAALSSALEEVLVTGGAPNVSSPPHEMHNPSLGAYPTPAGELHGGDEIMRSSRYASRLGAVRLVPPQDTVAQGDDMSRFFGRGVGTRGGCWVDVGASYLSSSRGNMPNSHQDRHEAPATTSPHPSVPTPRQGLPISPKKTTRVKTAVVLVPTHAVSTRSWRPRSAFIVALLIMVVISSLSAFFVSTHLQNTHEISASFGHVYLVSSWQANGSDSQGMNDELLIDLHNIAAPSPEKHYYAWLLGDANQPGMSALLLGKVNVSHGTIKALLPGDGHHSDLLALGSRFLLTEENEREVVNNPFLAMNTWRYYAQLPQQRSLTSNSHLRLLDHLRHLLVQAPELTAFGLIGGLAVWLLKNIQEILRWAVGARDESYTIEQKRARLINILYYLDGDCAKTDVRGVPLGTPTSPSEEIYGRDAHFALLNSCMQGPHSQMNVMQVAHDYLDHILLHTTGVAQSPGVTPFMYTLAHQVNTAVTRVKAWLGQLRRDAMQLAHMTDAQLVQPGAQALSGDMEMQASCAYAGQLDPETGAMLSGATGIFALLQQLATFDVTVYSGSSH